MIYVGSPCYTSFRDNTYLAHHGILGQKWGIRRFQNKDGTLTAAGKRRLAKLEKQQAKLSSKKAEVFGDKSESNSWSKKSISDMTDEELKKSIDRMELEKRYRNYLNELQPKESSNNKNRSTGKKAYETFLKPALINVGKQTAENALGMSVNKFGKMLGLKNDLYKIKSSGDKKDKDSEQDKNRSQVEVERLKLAQQRERQEYEREREERARKERRRQEREQRRQQRRNGSP